MSVFPNFSNIAPWIRDEFERRKDNPQHVSGLNPWVRIVSGVDNGLVIQSNTSHTLLRAAGASTAFVYGDGQTAGVVGQDWDGTPIDGGVLGLVPSPVVTSVEIDEGAGAISRKATISVTAFSLGQMEQISKYLLEPGFSIYIEWGWNQPDAFIGYQNTPTVEDIIKYQSFKKVYERREKTNGYYDNYLGFITGGSITPDGSKWNITVNCTGFTELPAYLIGSDMVRGEGGDDKIKSSSFTTLKIKGERNLGKRRFMEMFNQLPSNRRTNTLQFKFNEDTQFHDEINYINFDETVRNKINKGDTPGLSRVVNFFAKLFGGGTETVETEGESVDFPSGIELVDDKKFIKFSLFIKILNSIGSNGYVIGGKLVKFEINTKNTVISAFPEIFSTDSSRLFIPNPKTPRPSLAQAAENDDVTISENEFIDNSVTSAGKTAQFPSTVDITGGSVNATSLYDKSSGALEISKDGGYWGYLDDLYVNFDFIKGILETKNLLIKDGLYQVLNGISSAAGSIWNFQIVEITNTENPDNPTELQVVDLNFSGKIPTDETYTFDLIGTNGIFIDSSFDLDIGGMMMNKIIAGRLRSDINSSNPTTEGNLFATGLTDKLLTQIQLDASGSLQKAEADSSSIGDDSTVDQTLVREPGESRLEYNSRLEKAFQESVRAQKQARREQRKATKDEDKAAEETKEANIESFLQNVTYYPRVELTEDTTISNFDDSVYIGSINDLTLFETYKLNGEDDEGNVSILLPIKFSFGVHGISGIKRGDKFGVKGIPQKYSESGFFQVVSVKHSISGMLWKTTVEGQYRQDR